MKYRFIALVLLAAPFAAWGQTTVSAANVFESEAPRMRTTGKAVARVNGSVLTDRDLLREMFMIFPYARQHNGTFPQAMEADIRKGALKMIEFEELVYQEALRRKLTVAPVRLNLAEKNFIHQFHSSDQYRMYLATECQGKRAVMRAKIGRSLLIEDMLKAEVADKSVVSLAEASAYYRQHQEEFHIAESFSIQTISFMPPTTSAEQLQQARQRAEDALRQARATKSYEEFGLLAEKISEDDYRVVMGDHRLMERSKLPPQILGAVEKMQPGQVSDLIQVDRVFTIVRLNNHLPAGLRPFAGVKDSLHQYLQRQNVERLRAGLNNRLRKNAKIEEL